VPGWELPWVLTNPIYVFDPAEAAERARRAAWPEEPAPPASAELIDDFEGRLLFRPEHDPASTIEPPVLEPDAGVGGGRAARLKFRLAAPTPESPFVWCALVNREAPDLNGRHGLVFSIRADGVYRIFAQVRDQNPASADNGLESWYASVRTSTEWRRVALPFARFRSLNKRSDGKLDLDKAREMVFVLDQGAVKPGTAGTIWIDDLGVY
jgi:Carbohydrate binding domain (family 11)